MGYVLLAVGLLVWYLCTGIALEIEDHKKGPGSEYFADWVAGYGLVAQLGVLGRILFWPPIAKANSGFWGLGDHDDEYPWLIQIVIGTMLYYPCAGLAWLAKHVWSSVRSLASFLLPRFVS